MEDYHTGGSPLEERSPGLKPHGFAEPRNPESGRRDVQGATCLIERARRLVNALRRQLERPEVHRDALRRFQIQMCLHGFGWIHVNRLHEPAGLIGTDRQQREIDRTESPPNVAEKAGVGRVTGEKDADIIRRQDKTTPQGTVLVEWRSRREMMRRRQ